MLPERIEPARNSNFVNKYSQPNFRSGLDVWECRVGINGPSISYPASFYLVIRAGPYLSFH